MKRDTLYVAYASHDPAGIIYSLQVHVFETIIRVLGGLISGHMLLTRKPTLIPEYDGILLDLAVNLTDRMLPAFDTPSGMPSLFVNLKTVS
jgi:mannosidase alpha-like ER degradation enhancer 2